MVLIRQTEKMSQTSVLAIKEALEEKQAIQPMLQHHY
jgi:hypothetical protein